MTVILLTLYNKIHFKAAWDTRFHESEEYFYDGAGAGSLAPFLYYDEEQLLCRVNAHYQNVTVPFRSNPFAQTASADRSASILSTPTAHFFMTFAMPLNGSLDEALTDPALVHEMLESEPNFVGSTPVELHLPAFEMELKNSLKPEFEQLGLQSAFVKEMANIPYMTQIPDIVNIG